MLPQTKCKSSDALIIPGCGYARDIQNVIVSLKRHNTCFPANAVPNPAKHNFVANHIWYLHATYFTFHCLKVKRLLNPIVGLVRTLAPPACPTFAAVDVVVIVVEAARGFGFGTLTLPPLPPKLLFRRMMPYINLTARCCLVCLPQR